MASLTHARWQRFGLNAARYAIGPLGGLAVPWLVLHQSGSQAAWGDALRVIIPFQLFIHIAAWGSRDHLLRLFAITALRPPVLVVQSMITRAAVFLPILLLIGLLGSGAWPFAALWAGCAMLASSFEALFIWQKRFGFMLLLDATGLLAQCAALVLFGPLSTSTVLVTFILGATVKLGIIRAWSYNQPNNEPSIDAFSVSIRSHFMDAFPFMLIGFSGLLASRIDLYTANALVDPVALGRYQIIASLFVQCQALAALVVLPLSRDLLKLNVVSVARYARRTRMWAALGLIPLCALAWILFRYGFGFRLAWHTLVAAALMVWPVFAYVPFINTLYKHGRERIVMWSNFAAAATSCLLTALLLPSIGPTGGLLAAAAGQWLMLASITSAIRRVHAVPGM